MSLRKQIISGDKVLKDGQYEDFYENYKNVFTVKNGKLNGCSFLYSKIVKKVFLSEKIEWTLTHKDNYLDNLKHGKCFFYNHDGTVYMESNYNQGKLDGEQYHYDYSSGRKEITCLDTFKNGQIHGKHESWSMDKDLTTGKFINKRLVLKGFYVDGEQDGIWYEHFGNRSVERTYKNGKPHGRWDNYCDVDDVLKSVDIYEHGEKVGEEMIFDHYDGSWEKLYIDGDGNDLKKEYYNSESNLIKTEEY